MGQRSRGGAAKLHRWATLALLPPSGTVGATGAYLALVTGAARHVARRRVATLPLPDAPTTRFVVLVPSHDEALGIGRTLASLAALDYPGDLVQVHVVADNCSDDTAQVAAAHGAHVHVRHDPASPGKGPALAWAVQQLDAAGSAHEAVAVVDADTTVDRGFLRAMDAHLRRGARALQGHYAVRDTGRSWVTALRAAALAPRHYVRPLGRSLWGGSAGLHGNGMAFTRELLATHRWAAHPTEDIELEARLLAAGETVVFVPGAVVRAEMPARLGDATTQLARWERGRAAIVREHVPALLRSARQGSWRHRVRVLDAAVDHLLPPLSASTVATSATGVIVGALVVSRPTPMGLFQLATVGAAAVAQAAYVVTGLRMTNAPPEVWQALLQAPSYLAWRGHQLRGRSSSPAPAAWVRTPREPVGV